MIGEHARQIYQETALEKESRKAADFEDIEGRLPQRWSAFETGIIDKAISILGLHNPFHRKANPKDHKVWLLDNTAYRPVHPYSHDPQPWQAEFVSCFFYIGRKHIDEFVSNIADLIGLDGKEGADQEAKQRIAERE